jgi:DNA-binding transcriptional MerR regulator
MSAKSQQQQGAPRRETKRRKAERQGVSTRTIDRWTEQGILKRPIKINGRSYYDVDDEPRMPVK